MLAKKAGKLGWIVAPPIGGWCGWAQENRIRPKSRGNWIWIRPWRRSSDSITKNHISHTGWPRKLKSQPDSSYQSCINLTQIIKSGTPRGISVYRLSCCSLLSRTWVEPPELLVPRLYLLRSFFYVSIWNERSRWTREIKRFCLPGIWDLWWTRELLGLRTIRINSQGEYQKSVSWFRQVSSITFMDAECKWTVDYL